MPNNKNKPGGFANGVGYVSFLLVFAVICLTCLAVISFQTAASGDVLDEKNHDFNQNYYIADGSAKEILMRLDSAALAALESGFFADAFPELAAEIEGVSISGTPEGFKANYSVPISERLSLRVSAVFYSAPELHSGSRFSIDEWKTVIPDGNSEPNTLNVWDGTM